MERNERGTDLVGALALSARTPPMGWRSWNYFHENVNQQLIEDAAKSMAVKRDAVTGKILKDQNSNEGVSMLDLGYDDCGLDDNWQFCNAGVGGKTFHTAEGVPIINKELFPDLKKMTDFIHSLGLKAGWYHNNCICKELDGKMWKGDSHYQGDVNATVEFNFDSVKLDGCGPVLDLDLFYKLFSAKVKGKMMIENCHWGMTLPTKDNCPYHMYRTS